MKNSTVYKFVKHTFFVFIMGSAELVPGVSASAIALMGGIYEQMVEVLYQITVIANEVWLFVTRRSSIKQIFFRIFEIDFRFVIPLGVGVVISLATMTSVVLWSLENHPHYLFTLLFALLISAIVVPYLEMDRKSWRELLAFLITFGLCVLLTLLDESGMKTNPSYLLMFVGGFLGISGMILPGVSGGVIMLILGIYYYIIDSIHSFIVLNFTLDQLVRVGFFAVGGGIGFLVITVAMRRLMKSSRSIFMAIILGLVVSSVPTLWPFVDVVGYSESGKAIIEQIGIAYFTDGQIISMVLLFSVVVALITMLNIKSYKSNRV